MADWNDGSVKGIEDFCSAIWAGTGGITPEFALGYAQALADCGEIDRGSLALWADQIAKASVAHEFDFAGDDEDEMVVRIPVLTPLGRAVGWVLWRLNGFTDCASCAKDVLSRDEGTLVGKLLMGYWGYRCMREEANESR